MRGQVTMLVIVGLGILFAFGLVWFIVSAVAEGKLADSRQSSGDMVRPVDEFVVSCLRLAAQEGIVLLSRQGGVLYQSQGGPLPDPSQSELGRSVLLAADGSRVVYGVYPPIGTVGTPPFYFSEVPDYPWPTFPFFETPAGRITFTNGYFGVNRLVSLERPAEGSIQEQLEHFIRVRALSCLDWSVFAERFDVSPGELGINVTIGTEDVHVLANYPVDITLPAAGLRTSLDEFEVRIPTRLRAVHSAMGRVLDAEVTDATFNPSVVEIDGMRGVVERDVYGPDDLIILEDPESLIDGVPFVFRIARHNRAPALVYLEQESYSRWVCDGTELSPVPEGLFVDTRACVSDKSFTFAAPFTISVAALDPDEDVITSRYVLTGRSLPPGSYIVTPFDANVQKLPVRVEVWDGVPDGSFALGDWQQVEIPVALNNPVGD